MKNFNWNYLFQMIFVLTIFLSFHVKGQAQKVETKTDRELVKAAVEDYVLALYDVEPERIERSVDTTLHKIGYFDYDGEAYYHFPMTYQQLFDLSSTWNKDGKKANSESPKEIEIYEVYDKTASAKLTAEWGIDFMHLSKNADGNWKILNIMWQSDPEK